MTSRRLLVALLLVGGKSAAQVTPTAPVSTFNIQLEQRVGPEASVTLLVVRNSHLYFVCSESRESVVIETDLRGAFQGLIRTGIPKIANLDVDDHGYVYALSEDSWLTLFYPNGGIRKTAHLEPKVLALAVVDGEPMVADEKDQLHFLEREWPAFTLSAWPRPWSTFGLGSNRLAIWRPQGETISVLDKQEGLSTRGLGRTHNYIAAAGGFQHAPLFIDSRGAG